jgi:hypothetical protein
VKHVHHPYEVADVIQEDSFQQLVFGELFTIIKYPN